MCLTMNIDSEIGNLKKDLKSCQRMVTEVIKSKETCRTAHSLCECSAKKIPEGKKICKVTLPSQSGSTRGKGYHKHCVPRPPNPVPKKSPPRRSANFERKEHFETDLACVDVEIQSGKQLKKADVKCFAVSDDKNPLPRPRSSWGNILKEQNRSESTRHVSYDPCVRERSNAGDENWLQPHRQAMKDSGIQCSLPPSCDQPMYLNKNVFSSYNPIRTLQFLMDEFRSKAKTKCEPEMGDIIADMDGAILRLCQDYGSGVSHGTSAQDAASNCNRYLSAVPSVESGPLKNLKDEIPLRSKSQSVSSSSSHIRRLEESYQTLVKTCQSAEVRCTRLVEEREKQLRELGEKNLLLEQCARRESEYEKKLAEAMQNIKVMEAKHLQYTKSLTDLTQMLTKLQEENKLVSSLRETNGKLKVKLHELTQENHKQMSENQLMILEREKNRVLLQIKDQEIVKLKNDIQKISSLVNEELKNRVKSLKLSSSSSFDLSGSDLDSSSCRLSNKQSRGQKDNLVSSSPNSSSLSGSPLPYMSWQRVSKIPSEPALLSHPKRGQGNGHNEEQCKQEIKLPLNQQDCATGGMECIEVLKAQLQGFVDNMKEQLQLGSQRLGVEPGVAKVRDTEEPVPLDSSLSLCSMGMSELSDLEEAKSSNKGGNNNDSYIDLSPYKKPSSGW